MADDGTRPDDAYKHVISLGSVCATAKFLQQHHLRRYAGPFDWIFSDPCMLTHCLEDGFASFLDPMQYVLREQCKAGHRLYSDMIGHAVIWNHHCPLTQADHEHVRRCVERFAALLRAPGRKLLVLLSKRPLFAARCSNHRLADQHLPCHHIFLALPWPSELDDVRALFRALTQRTAAPFELLAVGLECHVGEGEEGVTLEASCEGDDDGAGGGSDDGGGGGAGGGRRHRATLRAYRQRCRAGHTGLAFLDAADAARFEALARPPRRPPP